MDAKHPFAPLIVRNGVHRLGLSLSLAACLTLPMFGRQPGDTAPNDANSPEIIQGWKTSAGKGVASSQFNLGMAYLRGDGVAKDASEAFKLGPPAAAACNL